MVEKLEFTTGQEDAGQRMDKCISVKLGKGYSRTQVKELMESGNITVDGQSVKPRYITKEGAKVSIFIPERDVQDIEPENIPLSLLYEDEHIMVIDKPAGMVVHPGAGNSRGTLVSALLYHARNLPERTDSSLRPGIVHRLDKDTSGVMVVAKSDKAMRSLSAQFKERSVNKTYLAVVTGNVEMDNGMIDAPLARQKTDRKKMGVEYSSGRQAKTVYHVLERYGDFTLIRVDLLTGRTHQIRVHMKFIGNPVAGDAEYGGRGGIARQALHAETLAFTHPETSEQLRFISPLPGDIVSFIKCIKENTLKRTSPK